MVYIRSKNVKGIDYAYLVKSEWDSNKNSSLQKTIKHLGKTSSITIEDIPEDYHNDPKIITFMTMYASKDITKKQTLLLKRENFSKHYVMVMLVARSRYMKSIPNFII